MKISKLFLVFGLLSLIGFSQESEKKIFEVDGQLLQRAEYRHGHIDALKENQEAASFITQRARLQASYKKDNLTMFVSVQDIRTWGDSPQVKRDDNNFSLHEGWANYQFTDNFSLKAGRQELNYDNARFLGNLDWFMQGRAHDFALLKYEKKNLKLHVGFGYNQNGGNLPTSEAPYTVTNQYKRAQMLRYENKVDKFLFSFLVWNETRQNNVLQDNPKFDNTTIGLPTLNYTFGNHVISGFAYYQTGKDMNDKKLSGYDVSAQFTRTVFNNADSGRKLRVLGGFEMISGTDQNVTDKNNSFNPLYGTNHLFNGYLDVFYVANRHINSVGLNDYFVKARYDFNKKFFTQLDYHFFQSNAKLFHAHHELNKNLGSEVDLSLGYIVSPSFSIQGGYSHLFHTDSYAHIKGNNLKAIQNWAYVMLVFRPNMPQKFIGILF